ncbi:MAG: CYTH domain-containing protein [Pedobacter sp.]|nr:MAG: CYTH domain-containing protein [Pedobacter sp.]
MATEIERKFLVDQALWQQLSRPEGKHYRQGYLSTDARKTIRVRISADEAFLTVKGASTGISRTEIECGIPRETAMELLSEFVDAQVEKVRYVIPFAGHHWEVDEFIGDNAGLVVAEIELSHEDETFEKPEWVKEEVSDDERYYNASLAVKPYRNWNQHETEHHGSTDTNRSPDPAVGTGW